MTDTPRTDAEIGVGWSTRQRLGVARTKIAGLEAALRRAEEERDGWRDGSVVALRRIESLSTALREMVESCSVTGKPETVTVPRPEVVWRARRALNHLEHPDTRPPEERTKDDHGMGRLGTRRM